MSVLLWFRARDHRGLDGDRPARDERRRTRLRAGAPAEDAGGDFLGSARNGRSPGEESLADGVAAQAFEAKPLTGLDLANQRHRMSPALNNKAGEPRLASLIAFKSATLWSEE